MATYGNLKLAGFQAIGNRKATLGNLAWRSKTPIQRTKGNEMEFLSEITLAVLGFVLGLFASSYGARIGRALDARSNMLADFADRVDMIVERCHLLYQIARTRSKSSIHGMPWTDSEVKELARRRLTTVQRLMGIADARGIAGSELFHATQDLAKTVLTLEAAFNKGGAGEGSTEDLKAALTIVDDAAQRIHSVIASLQVRGLPFWMRR